MSKTTLAEKGSTQLIRIGDASDRMRVYLVKVNGQTVNRAITEKDGKAKFRLALANL